MAQWEYYIVRFENCDLQVELNKLGVEGWECVLGVNGEFVFKRKLQ